MVGDLAIGFGTKQTWGQRKRLAFIDFRLAWEGRVNRSDLTSHFKISVPQASADLAEYQKIAPHNTAYNKQAKAYVAAENFQPICAEGNPYEFLNSLRQINAQMLPKQSTFLGWVPSHAVVRLPTRRVDFHILRESLHAIRTQTRLCLTYQSMNRALPSERSISPHALAFDGNRWHLRAYCFERRDFRDFVMPRIMKANRQPQKGVDPADDASWFRELDVVVEPAPHLTDGQRRAVELDYGMVGGRLHICTKEALLIYLVQQLPLFGSEGRLKHNQLILSNESELRPIFDRLGIEF
jgi:hypothetical protein